MEDAATVIYLIDLDQIKSGEKKLKRPQKREGEREREREREREEGLDERGSESDQGLLCQREGQRDQILTENLSGLEKKNQLKVQDRKK